MGIRESFYILLRGGGKCICQLRCRVRRLSGSPNPFGVQKGMLGTTLLYVQELIDSKWVMR